MEDIGFNKISAFRKAALDRTFTVLIVSTDLGMSVLKYSGLSVFDVQEFLILVDSSCTINITCDSD